MSTPAGSNVAPPYIAPWAANWNKYSTQLLAFTAPSVIIAQLLSPDGQWWRTPLVGTTLNSSATASNRIAFVQINPPGAAVYNFPAPGVQVANTVGTYTWGIGLNAFVTPSATTGQFFQAPLPDILWPPGTFFKILTAVVVTGDNFANATMATEIYTEFVADPATGATVLIPSPVLT